jgi:hypothetical protein
LGEREGNRSIDGRGAARARLAGQESRRRLEGSIVGLSPSALEPT